MSSNRQKRDQLAIRKWRKGERARVERDERKEEEKARARTRAAHRGLLPIDYTKVQSTWFMGGEFGVPIAEGDYYLDYPFNCEICGKAEIWTSPQQKWWYEECGGKMESKAIHCRECRKKRAEVKRLAEEGKLKKQQAKNKKPHSS